MNMTRIFTKPIRSRAIRRAWLVASVIGFAAMGCENSLTAPEGAIIHLVMNPTVLAVGGDTAIASAFVTQDDGSPVRDGTRVSFIASGGGVCPTYGNVAVGPLSAFVPAMIADTSCKVANAAPITVVATVGGLARVLYFSGAASGSTTLEARSGVATKTATFTLSSLVAPSDGKAVIQASADTADVGAPVAAVVLLTNADGSPVADGTRVVFAASEGTVSKQIAVTRSGFAETVFKGTSAGAKVITVSSGLVKATTNVVIR
jgi:hypothetical protein